MPMMENSELYRRRCRMIQWVLRITVAMQCLSNWHWLTQIEETPLLHWLLNPADVGGLSWNESTALAVQQTIGWATLLAGGLVLWRPHIVVLGPLVLLQTLITVAMWRIAEGFALQLDWAPRQLLLFFPFATQLARIAAPLGLLLLWGACKEQIVDTRRVGLAIQIIRYAIAIVFLAHGFEACQLNPNFLDLLIISAERLLGIRLTQANAEQWLAAIGVLDILLAFTSLGTRWLPVVWWLAFWGGITAASRIVAQGGGYWHEALARFPHFGLPLAIALWWHLLKYHQTSTSPREEDKNNLK